jgi:hypothetical protein
MSDKEDSNQSTRVSICNRHKYGCETWSLILSEEQVKDLGEGRIFGKRLNEPRKLDSLRHGILLERLNSKACIIFVGICKG